MPEFMDYEAGLPARMKSLGRDAEGRPIPWFVDRGDHDERSDAEVDFRVVDNRKIILAIRDALCWVCGQPMEMGRGTFVIGPMCAVNRISSEPPSHFDCAVYSATRCPFLATPRRKRRDKGLPKGWKPAAGIPVMRNPGVALVWVSRRWNLVQAPAGHAGILFQIGAPLRTLWFAEGQPATRDQVMASIDSGLPILREAAERDGPEALADLESQYRTAMAVVPS